MHGSILGKWIGSCLLRGLMHHEGREALEGHEDASFPGLRHPGKVSFVTFEHFAPCSWFSGAKWDACRCREAQRLTVQVEGSPQRASGRYQDREAQGDYPGRRRDTS